MKIGGSFARHDMFPTVAPSFDDPIAMLCACHDKVRRFSALSLKLAEHVALHGADAEAQTAAQAILRYFDHAAPLHHADEEQDLFPALLSLSRPALHATLTELTQQHPQLDALWQSVRVWLLATVAGTALPPPSELPQFVALYTEHAAREEAELYPAAADLPPEQLQAAAQRMQARRGA